MARSDDVPEEFVLALRSLRSVTTPTDVLLEEIPGPGRLAPYSAALTGEVRSVRRSSDELSSGRFVVLFDPQGQETWEGQFRLVTLVRAPIETEVGGDPLLADVAWSWFVDALSGGGIDARAAGGTVTRVESQTFGTLSERQEQNDLEIRASWTADGPELGPHLRAWTTLLRSAAGVPPLPEGVLPLRG